MNQILTKTTGWRGSADIWVTAAHRALIAGGIDAVKLGPLAQTLGLSRTSFYGHFASREDLLESLLLRWQAATTDGLVARCGAYASNLPEAVLNLFDAWIDPALFDPRFDMAVRAWGQGDAAVWDRVTSADATRIAAMTAMMERWGIDADEADIRARTMYFTQVGYFAMRMQERESREHRIARMPPYVKTFCGQSPDSATLARFRARHRE